MTHFEHVSSFLLLQYIHTYICIQEVSSFPLTYMHLQPSRITSRDSAGTCTGGARYFLTCQEPARKRSGNTNKDHAKIYMDDIWTKGWSGGSSRR